MSYDFQYLKTAAKLSLSTAELEKSAELVAQIKNEQAQSIRDLENTQAEMEKLKTELKNAPKSQDAPPPTESENQQRIVELEKLLSEQAADLAATRDQLKSVMGSAI